MTHNVKIPNLHSGLFQCHVIDFGRNTWLETTRKIGKVLLI